VRRWPRIIGDRASTGGRAKIGALVWICARKKKSDYKEKGGQIKTGDPV